MANWERLRSDGWLHSGRWLWARALAWLVVLAVISVVAFNLATHLILRAAVALSGDIFTTGAAAPLAVRFVAAVIGCAVMIAVYAAAVRLVERRPVEELDRTPILIELGYGLLIGGALIGAIVAVNWAAGWVDIHSSPIAHIGEALRQTLRSAVVEEILLRLIVFRLLWRAFGIWPGLLLSAAAFGALHLGNPDVTPFAAISLFAGEGVAVGTYLLTGRIWVPIGFHAGWNFTQGWLFGAVVSGVEGFGGGPLQTRPVAGVDPVLSGGGFGPEGSLACLLLSLVASGMAMVIAVRRSPAFRDGRRAE
jgi:membrane protease YdiL (CAAX protease family)